MFANFLIHTVCAKLEVWWHALIAQGACLIAILPDILSVSIGFKACKVSIQKLMSLCGFLA